MDEPRTSLLDQRLTERIARLRVTARRAVDGVRSGIHRSPHRGASMIFAEHRDYRPGDDLRMLDWRAYARNDRYTIKRFEQETHLRASLLLDASASMAYDGGNAAQEKSSYAATLLAAMGFLLLGQGDAVGAQLVDATQDPARSNLPARTRPAHLEALLELLGRGANVEKHETAPSLAQALSVAFERVGRRGLVVLASDLLDLDAYALRPLAQLGTLGHELMVFHVMHRDELEFPFRHGVRFESSETTELLDTDADALRRGYLAEVSRFVESCRQRCIEAGARYVFARTDSPVEQALADMLARSNGARRWA